MAASVVKDIMTKSIVTIESTKTALDAAKLMSEKSISSLFVVHESDPIGIVTERDFIKKICSKELVPSQVKVTDIMSKIVTTAEPETPIDVAVQRMINHKIRRLPVVDNDKIVGIITVTDLAKHLRTTLLLDGTLQDTDTFEEAMANVNDDLDQ
jgi:CBS domain-containing protein